MKYFFLIGCLSIIFSGCIKNDKGCVPVKPESEEPEIRAYATTSNISATKLANGICYEILRPGYGATPTTSSTVKVTYTGKLLNGFVFEQVTSPITFKVGQVIEGWQIGLGLIKKGGRIHLILPSVYGYGCNGNANKSIPPNAILYYDIDLIDVQ